MSYKFSFNITDSLFHRVSFIFNINRFRQLLEVPDLDILSSRFRFRFRQLKFRFRQLKFRFLEILSNQTDKTTLVISVNSHILAKNNSFLFFAYEKNPFETLFAISDIHFINYMLRVFSLGGSRFYKSCYNAEFSVLGNTNLVTCDVMYLSTACEGDLIRPLVMSSTPAVYTRSGFRNVSCRTIVNQK